MSGINHSKGSRRRLIRNSFRDHRRVHRACRRGTGVSSAGSGNGAATTACTQVG